MLDKTNPTYCAVRGYIISGIVRIDGATQEQALKKGDALLGMLHISTSSGFEPVLKEGTEPVWWGSYLRDSYPLVRPQFRHYTWENMGEGSWEGGRHQMIRWLARRGRPHWFANLKKTNDGKPVVSIATKNRALVVLKQFYGETLEDI